MNLRAEDGCYATIDAFAVKRLLPCWLVLLHINLDNRVRAQKKIRIGILSAYSLCDRTTDTGMFEGDFSDQVKE